MDRHTFMLATVALTTFACAPGGGGLAYWNRGEPESYQRGNDGTDGDNTQGSSPGTSSGDDDGAGGGSGPPTSLSGGSGWWPDVTSVLQSLGERPPTTRELRQYARELVGRYPGLCELRTPETDPDLMGYTRRGTPMEVLVVHGDMPDAPAALAYPQVHSNEPWATGTAKALLDYVTTEPAARQRTWVVLLGLDPDAAMRGEGWAAYTPLGIENAIRTFYRPPMAEQPEYSFDENSAMPEVQALVRVIREHRPDMIFSLHNCGIAFPNVMVTDRVSAIVDVVARAAAESGFTNFESIGDFKGLEQLGPGVFQAAADSPWARISDYASRHRADRATVLAVEGPMWRGREPGPTLVGAADIAEKQVVVLTRLVDKLPSVPASELCRAATWFVARSKQLAEGYRAEYDDWRTQTAATPDDPAPVANDAEYAYVVPLRAAGIMWRFVHELLVTDPADAVLDQVERELDEHITQWSKDYGREFGVGPVHFADTVGYQLKVILATVLPHPDHDRPRHDGDAPESGG